MTKKFKQVMTPQQFAETIKEVADKDYPTYKAVRNPEPVMPHIQEELDKIVKNDLKTKNLEDETALHDARINEIKEARTALYEVAKTIDKLYPDLMKVSEDAAIETRHFRDSVKRFAEIIEQCETIKVNVALDENSRFYLNEHTKQALASEKSQMDEHVKKMKSALKDTLDENYQTLKERLSKDKGVYLTSRVFAWCFGFLIICEFVAGFALAMWLK